MHGHHYSCFALQARDAVHRGGLVRTLQGSIGGIEGAFVSAASKMSGSVKQTMMMMQTMSSMMEDMLQESLHICE